MATARRRRPGRALRPASTAANREMRRQARTCCSLSAASQSSPHSITRRRRVRWDVVCLSPSPAAGNSAA
uniref:Uncharacterized protein n=1 Tax=Arundo donax TaxID=35708 RepID=A0A0A9FX53_ARUDO